MKLTALELPDEIRHWPAWLENQVVGSQLRFLVQQFEAMSGKQVRLETGESWGDRLNALLSNELPEVLENGLGKLSEKRLRTLIQQPRTLLALQELVFVEGGEYWEKIPALEDLRQIDVSVHERATVNLPKSGSQEPVQRNKSTISINRRSIAVVAALAASILIAVIVSRPPAASGRYFARADLLTRESQGKDFLRLLSRAIKEDWQQGQKNVDLKSEIRLFADSCDQLLAAELLQLDSEVAADLKQRCQKWRDAFTGYIHELESGETEDSVRSRADETVRKLVTVIENLG